jgi:thiol-disulfide isomerase/thioredoxin
MKLPRRLRLLLVSLGFLAAFSTAQGRRAPALELKDLSGHTRRLSALRGQIVVLNFWATWCGPCREEMPRLSRLGKEYTSRNVHVVAISIDERKDQSRIPGILRDGHLDLDVWIGGNTWIMSGFGLSDVVPATVILDERGNIVSRIIGEAGEDDLRRRLDWLIGGRNGTAPEPVLRTT